MKVIIVSAHCSTSWDLLYSNVPAGIINQHWQRLAQATAGLTLTKRPVPSMARNVCSGWFRLFRHLPAPAPSKEPSGLKGRLWLRLRHYRNTHVEAHLCKQMHSEHTCTWTLWNARKEARRPPPTGGFWVVPQTFTSLSRSRVQRCEDPRT